MGLSSDRYPVLQDVFDPDRYPRIGVLGLREGWLGYLWFQPRPVPDEGALDCAVGSISPQAS